MALYSGIKITNLKTLNIAKQDLFSGSLELDGSNIVAKILYFKVVPQMLSPLTSLLSLTFLSLSYHAETQQE